MANAVIAKAQGCARVWQVDAVGTAPTLGWLTSAARTSSGTTDQIVGVANYTAAWIDVNVTAASGSSPTLNIYLQQILPDGTSWADIASMTQITGTARKVWGILSSGSTELAVTDGSLAANSIKAMPFGQIWRIKYTIGGTTPSFTFAIGADFME